MTSFETTVIPVVQVKVNNSLLSESDTTMLQHVQVSRSHGSISRAELRFVDRDLGLTDRIKPSDTIEVGASAYDGSDVAVIFTGMVTSVGIRVLPDTPAALTVEALDDARKLGNTITMSADLNTTASDILTTIAGEASLTPEIDSLSVSYDHVYRTGTAIEFLDMLAARYGLWWRVADGKLKVTKSNESDTVELTSGQNLRRLDVRWTTQGLPTTVKVRGWDTATKQAIVGQSTSTAFFPEVSAEITTKNSAVNDGGELIVHRPSVPSQTEADNVAQGLMDRMGSMMVTARGEADFDARIRPGARVQLQNLGSKWSGRYTVSSVEHVWGADRTFVSRFTVGSLDQHGLSNLIGGSSASDLTGAELRTGITIGIVTNINDEDGLGRVKVKLPAVSDDLETAWARVVQPGAGPDRGLMMIPEVNDEVAVAFENGDLQRPFVIGGLWNGVDALPANHDVVKDGAVVSRSLTTREGSYIALLEEDANEGKSCIQLRTSTGVVVLHLGEDHVELITDDVDVTIDNTKSKLEMLKSGAVSLMAMGGDLTLSAGSQGNVIIEGNNIELKASQGLKTSSTSSTEIKATAGVKVEASGITEIKGSMVKLN